MRRSPRTTRSHSSASSSVLRREKYSDISRKPLHILIFLLPLLLLYEIGSFIYLSRHAGAHVETIKAYRILMDLFSTFGADSIKMFHLPGVALIVVLLCWHVFSRDGWEIRPAVVGLMWIEAAFLTIPLLVLSQLIARLGMSAPSLAETGSLISQLTWQQKLTISIGAGIYEELLFRMLIIGLLLILLTDVFRAKQWFGYGLAVLISAILFTLYHQPVQHGVVIWPDVVLYMVSGVFFGYLFLLRGFGIVVAVHAIYDIAVLLILPLLVTGKSPFS